MMQTEQIRVQDAVEGSSLIEIRAALQHLESGDRNIRTYGVRVLRNGKTTVVFTPKDDETRALAVRDSAVLSAAELKDLLASSKQTNSLRSGSLAPMLAAAQIFEQRKLDLADYRVTLLRSGNSYVVTFTDKDAQVGGRGNPGKRLGFEVELGASDLRVIRSHFIR
jgi:hypothetical protein